jgi:hypothetical protein
MTTLGDTRVIPENLDETYRRVHEVWEQWGKKAEKLPDRPNQV